MKRTASILIFFLACCVPSSNNGTPPILTVHHSIAVSPWISELYECVPDDRFIVKAVQRSADFQDFSAELTIRLGEPEDLKLPAYAISTVEISIVVNNQNPYDQLDITDIRGLFNGQIQDWKELGGPERQVQVWVYAPGEDIQQLFDAVVLQHQPVSSLANIAVNIETAINSINTDPGAVGFIPSSYITSEIKTIEIENAPITLLNIPVLMITQHEPAEEILAIVVCLQN